MVNFVLVIPKQTLNVLLVSWLRLSEVGKLDAALCDRACRDIFEHSLSLRNFGVVRVVLYSNPCFIRWVMKRKIKLDAWLIQGYMLRTRSEKRRYQLLQSIGPTLRSAVINCGKDVDFNNAYFTEDHTDNVSDSSGSDSSHDSVRCTPIVRVGRDGDGDGNSEQDVNHAVEMKLMDDVIADFTLRCTQLVYFSVIGKHTSSVLPLLKLNPNLCFVTLTCYPKVLRCIANLCPQIMSISITEKATCTDLELFALSVPPKLTQLCLPDTPVGKRFLSHLLLSAPSLRELRLGVVRYDWADLQMTCPNLVVFRCFFPLNVLKPELIANLSNVMPHVRTLILLCISSASQGVVATMMTKILDSFPALRQLCSLQAFEDKISTLEQSVGVQTHTSHSYLLEELYLCNSGHSLSHSILQRCPALHTLGFGSATDGSAVMKYLPESVKRFTCFSLHCVNARGYAIFKNLYELEIGGNCQQLTDSVLVNIAKNCPHLTLLRLNFPPRVTLKGALAVLKLCPHLRSLEYHGVRANRNQEANEAVAAVMELCLLHYPQLQHIYL